MTPTPRKSGAVTTAEATSLPDGHLASADDIVQVLVHQLLETGVDLTRAGCFLDTAEHFGRYESGLVGTATARRQAIDETRARDNDGPDRPSQAKTRRTEAEPVRLLGIPPNLHEATSLNESSEGRSRTGR